MLQTVSTACSNSDIVGLYKGIRISSFECKHEGSSHFIEQGIKFGNGILTEAESESLKLL